MNHRVHWLVVVALVLVAGPLSAAEQAWVELTPGPDLAGWKFRNEKAKKTWQAVDNVKLDEKDPKRLVPASALPGQAAGVALLNGDDGRGSDLISERSFGDCEIHVEFMVPKGSNSGIYVMGQYEVQILDSFGKPEKDLQYGDVGGIYDHQPPRKNAAKAPGEWQTFDIVFYAPRFDAQGKKIAPAVFFLVKLNDVLVQEKIALKGPTTSSLGGKEKAEGPILLQGDHGPVAYRNIRVRPMRFRQEN
jgi:hypothetical protein